MKSNGSSFVDGQACKDGEEIWDLGSLVCTTVPLRGVRKYEGLSKDVDKLPHYKDLSTGSSCLMVDTGEFYKYEKSTDTWYKL